jgi:hypothetical protein
MSREAQVRFREDVGVQVPCVTRFQATPAVGFFNFQISSKDKASFLLFIKNNKKCKRMKFRLNR